jgi:Cu/Ag efflux pump CusA
MRGAQLLWVWDLKPLAVVVMGGLITSTALTLLVLPAIYVAVAERVAKAQEQELAATP